MNTKILLFAIAASGIGSLVAHQAVMAHGDVTPQSVDISGLPELDDEWLVENPWRDPESEYWQRAIEVGASGYNQNCARCHGLEVISGGLAPDLRYLEADDYGDEWYLERYIHGYTQNGTTKMPAFGDLLGQEAAWAIRTYIETRPDEGALDDHASVLKTMRDELAAMADKLDAGEVSLEDIEAALESAREALSEIDGSVATASGAARAESAVTRAYLALDGSETSVRTAAEFLTVGLSAAQ